MQQIDNKKICKYCLGCNKLEDKNFKGVMNCKNFISGYENWTEMRREELKKSGNK
jgi:hypothetical protein